MSEARLIAVDWGTTTLRCYLVSDTGTILGQNASPKGILNVESDAFETTLANAISQLPLSAPKLPVLMSGMIGSRQGWHEAPYVSCPTGLLELTLRLVELPTGVGRDVFIVPGLDTRNSDGVPDVIRGEETQLLGAMAARGIEEGLVVLPGTHSKWVTISANRIAGFATYMTGEVYAALCDHTILGRLMSDRAHDPAHFERGLHAGGSPGGAPGELLHRIFSARTLCLAGELPQTGVASYLSGLLIGSEICAAMGDNDQPFYIMAGSTLADLYAKAAAILDIRATVINEETIVAGHYAIAEAANI